MSTDKHYEVPGLADKIRISFYGTDSFQVVHHKMTSGYYIIKDNSPVSMAFDDEGDAEKDLARRVCKYIEEKEVELSEQQITLEKSRRKAGVGDLSEFLVG